MPDDLSAREESVTALGVTLVLGAASVLLPGAGANTWATQLFTEIGVRVVTCPAYTQAGENQPI